MSRTKTITETIATTIRWTLVSLLVSAYLLGSVIVGMYGIGETQNRTTEMYVEPAQRVADSTVRSVKAHKD